MILLFLRASRGKEFESDPFIGSKLGLNYNQQRLKIEIRKLALSFVKVCFLNSILSPLQLVHYRRKRLAPSFLNCDSAFLKEVHLDYHTADSN